MQIAFNKIQHTQINILTAFTRFFYVLDRRLLFLNVMTVKRLDLHICRIPRYRKDFIILYHIKKQNFRR